MFMQGATAFADLDPLAMERAKEFAKSDEPISKLASILAPPDRGRVPADILKSVWESHRSAILMGATTSEQFGALSTFTRLAVLSPNGKQLLPELMNAVEELDAPTEKLSESRGWDRLMIRTAGDKLGVVISCILEIAGREGFDQLYEQFEKNGKIEKTGILLEQVVHLKKEPAFAALSQRLRSEKNPQLKEMIAAQMRDLRNAFSE